MYWQMIYVKNLAQVTKKVFWIWKRPRWSVRPSAWFSLWLNIVYWVQVTLPLQNTTFPIVYNVTWKEVVMEDHIGRSFTFWTSFAKKKEWDAVTTSHSFLNLFFLGCLDSWRDKSQALNIAYADNTGHIFGKIFHDNLLALLIVFDDVTCKTCLRQDKVNSGLFLDSLFNSGCKGVAFSLVWLVMSI